MRFSLKDQTAIIVGSSSGMGRATAKTFAEAGAKVVLAARSKDKLGALASEIGDSAFVCATDAANEAEVERLISATVERFGRIDTLVYVAGVNIPARSLKALTSETWDMMIQTNLTGAFYCTKAVLPVMRKQKSGLIIYVSSAAVQLPDASGVSYQASKHGLVGLAHGTVQRRKRERHPHVDSLSRANGYAADTEAPCPDAARSRGKGAATPGYCRCVPVNCLAAAASVCARDGDAACGVGVE
jgi:NADP-dependent 3-hydroxy acid dehydrogenase YdfG